MTVNRCQSELLAFAAAARGEEWADELALALTACANAGWAWERAARQACQLILADGAQPRELRDAARVPAKAAPGGTPPPSVAADLAAVRARAEAVTARRRAAEPGDGGTA